MNTTAPNLVFIMPDQLRADFLGCYGGRAVTTPHIDALAAEGVRYADAVSICPVCVPARASLLTGLGPLKTRVLTNNEWLRPDRRELGIASWPELLAARGYHTAAIGKMHFYPWDASEGFHERVIAEDKRWLHIKDDYYDFLVAAGHRKYHGEEHEGYHENKGAIVNRLPLELTVDRFVGAEACKFIERQDPSRPFAVMVGLPSPHCPYDPVPESLAQVDPARVPEPFPASPEAPFPRARYESLMTSLRGAWNKIDYRTFTTEQKRKLRAHYAALVKQVDDEVGAIVATLHRRGLWDNTVVIFTSDHGDMLGDHDLIAKNNFYESACRVPLIVRCPGIAPAVNTAPVTLLDVTATLLRLAGAEPPAHFDSIALPGLNLPESRARTEQIGVLPNSCMVRADGWKLIKYDTGEAFLFNYARDPGEQQNLIDEPAARERLHRMDGDLTSYLLQQFTASTFDQAVGSNSNSIAFGERGWRRSFPARIKS